MYTTSSPCAVLVSTWSSIDEVRWPLEHPDDPSKSAKRHEADDGEKTRVRSMDMTFMNISPVGGRPKIPKLGRPRARAHARKPIQDRRPRGVPISSGRMKTAVLSREQMTWSNMYVRLAGAQQEPTRGASKSNMIQQRIVFEVSLFE